ncbi:hypothetical protein [Streptomyces sp. SCSIO ZS0520]|uniref:hypothetical protein n=1 Tax=Streptomyces sp. SCSIO ZS0520 TaxID=2892996 RepID=UPI0021DB3252|nr:hypothetical protein [Streptomyces sp. SCSIO ZS0520]
MRYCAQQRELIRTLRAARFEVWIVSASPEPVIEAWTGAVGVPDSRTVGIRSLARHGKLTPRLRACGSVRREAYGP